MPVLSTRRVTNPPHLSSAFSGGCLISWEQPDPPSLYLSGNELCTGATVRVPTERAMSGISGTHAIGLPPLPLSIQQVSLKWVWRKSEGLLNALG